MTSKLRLHCDESFNSARLRAKSLRVYVSDSWNLVIQGFLASVMDQ